MGHHTWAPGSEAGHKNEFAPTGSPECTQDAGMIGPDGQKNNLRSSVPDFLEKLVLLGRDLPEGHGQFAVAVRALPSSVQTTGAPQFVQCEMASDIPRGSDSSNWYWAGVIISPLRERLLRWLAYT
jgi:hypothetical protein